MEEHNQDIVNLINSQVEDIKKSISNTDEYMKVGKTAKAFSSLRMIAHTDAMKIFGARVLNRVSEEVLEEEDYDIYADNWHIVYETEEFRLKYPIIHKVDEIIIHNRKLFYLLEEKRKFDEYGNHIENLASLEKLEKYHEDSSLEKLNDYLKISGQKKISLVTFRMDKDSYKYVVSDEHLQELKDLVELGNKAYEAYDKAMERHNKLLERAEESLADFLELGYEFKVIK